MYSGSPESNEFYKWIGICIKEWANIEAALYNLCGIVLRKASPEQVAVIFGRTPTIDARLSLTSDLLVTVLQAESPESAEWKQLLKELRDLLSTRNLLAHAPVEKSQGIAWIETEEGEELRTSWLSVSTSEADLLRGRALNSVSDEQLRHHSEAVHMSWINLLRFASNVREMQHAKRPQRKSRPSPGRGRASSRSRPTKRLHRP
jgi:hypothetical protein